jgi:hypothetical protein
MQRGKTQIHPSRLHRFSRSIYVEYKQNTLEYFNEQCSFSLLPSESNRLIFGFNQLLRFR